MERSASYLEALLSSLASDAPGYLGGPGAINGLDLSQGEVRLGIPDDLLALNLLSGGPEIIRYGSPQGLKPLREAYLRATQSDALGIDGTLVTSGAKQALWLAFLLVVGAGTTVLLPEPGWAPYRVWARTLGARIVVYDPARDDVADTIAQRLREGVDVVVLNFPNNPTGAELGSHSLENIVEEAARVGAAVISDEVYREFGMTTATLVGSTARHDVRVLVADSISKWTATAGLRIGLLVGSAQLIEQALALRSTIDSCPPGVTQHIACHLLGQEAGDFRGMLRRRAHQDVARLRAVLESHGIEVISTGAIYVWARASDGVRHIQLPHVALAGAPGAMFQAPGMTRLCPLTDDVRVLGLLAGAIAK